MISPNQLEQFGLNQKEASIYLASLALGPNPVQNIAQKAQIHRVTAYDTLNALIQKGIINQTSQGKKRLFIAAEPEHILNSLKQKEQSFSSLIPELKAIQNKHGQKPKVMYFEGRQAVWQAHLDRIKHKPELKENLVYCSSEKLITTYPQQYKKFVQGLIDKDIQTKILAEKSHFGLREKTNKEGVQRQVKFLPTGKEFKAHTVIYGDRVLTISWNSMLAVIIEDKHNADNQRIVFNLLWEYLP